MRNKNATLVFPSKLNHLLDTDKSLSEALIINPKYDDRFFIELQIQYKKNTPYSILYQKRMVGFLMYCALNVLCQIFSI